MLDSIPQPAWIRLIDYLGLIDACQLRQINRSIKDRIDNDIFQVYKRIEGKQDVDLSEYLNTKIIYPKLELPKMLVPFHNYINITRLHAMLRYNDLMDLIESKEMFNNILHRTVINDLDIKKLLKAIKLVILGLSDHYTIKCMGLTCERTDWAIQFKTQGICDIFCYRGASEFNETQKNNFLKVQQHTFQDTFAFKAAQQLNIDKIDIVIDKKQQDMLDYDALELAGCENIFANL